ncbi:hypothetical protein PVAND_004348 [Polypedilum vanderplanki]|uniref:SMP-30/Gluconolactonase/LRE-like region domain-containing protein n=1 Tax=Polypedilum vanderplanki TaxID=319348 RepID=A0A9J6BYV5_POLVA|nr:hypothetical protein PVAND_004348 [Polypedilum vanderplanki]
MSAYKVEQVRESVMNISGKNIFYCHDTNFLFWCDVLGGQICKLDLCTNRISMCRIKDERIISFIIPIEGFKDQFIVGAGKKLMIINWDGVTTMAHVMKILCEIPVNGIRINQCKVDKQGRLFFGTMISEESGSFFNLQKRVGSFYRFTMDEGLVELKDRIGLSNGIAWNKNFTKMFYVDSYDLNIYEFDYDLTSGNIGNSKVLIDLSVYSHHGKKFAAGITTDKDDNIFVTMLGCGQILKFNAKSRKIEQEIKLNVQIVTSCEFGGKNFDTLYVTTSCSDVFGPQNFPAGFLFKVYNLNTNGTEMYKFKMNYE